MNIKGTDIYLTRGDTSKITLEVNLDSQFQINKVYFTVKKNVDSTNTVIAHNWVRDGLESPPGSGVFIDLENNIESIVEPTPINYLINNVINENTSEQNLTIPEDVFNSEQGDIVFEASLDGEQYEILFEIDDILDNEWEVTHYYPISSNIILGLENKTSNNIFQILNDGSIVTDLEEGDELFLRAELATPPTTTPPPVTTNIFVVSIDHDDTKDLNFGKYRYDVQINYINTTDNNPEEEILTIIKPSIFSIEDEVTIAGVSS